MRYPPIENEEVILRYLLLLPYGKSTTQISRDTLISRSTIRDRLNSLSERGLVISIRQNDKNMWRINPIIRKYLAEIYINEISTDFGHHSNMSHRKS
jgi:DNA-binding transcriptional ArsR family regulator